MLNADEQCRCRWKYVQLIQAEWMTFISMNDSLRSRFIGRACSIVANLPEALMSRVHIRQQQHNSAERVNIRVLWEAFPGYNSDYLGRRSHRISPDSHLMGACMLAVSCTYNSVNATRSAEEVMACIDHCKLQIAFAAVDSKALKES